MAWWRWVGGRSQSRGRISLAYCRFRSRFSTFTLGFTFDAPALDLDVVPTALDFEFIGLALDFSCAGAAEMGLVFELVR